MNSRYVLGIVVLPLVLGMVFSPMALAADAQPPVVAVFLMEGRGSPLTANETEALTDYLSTKLVEVGKFRIIPRGELFKHIATEISGTKQDSYKDNFDTSKQIEIGRDLSAEYSISSRVSKIGSKCLMTASVWDLKQAIQIKAATETAPCHPVEDLVQRIDNIAAKLTAAMTGQAYVATTPTAVPTAPVAATPEPAAPAIATKAASKYLSLPATEFGPTDTIPLKWSANTAKRDWVSVAMRGMPDDNFITYMNTGKDKTGTFSMTGLDPGEYEARIYLDYSNVGYKVADRLPFRVRSAQVASLPPSKAGGGALRSAYMSIAKKTFAAGETVEVSWFNTPGDGHDWITVVPKTSPDTEVGSYDYTKDKDGSFSVSGLAPGEYEARFYLNYKKVGYKVSDRLSFWVR